MKKVLAALFVYATLMAQSTYTYQKFDWVHKNSISAIKHPQKTCFESHKTTFKACAIAGTIALVGSAIALIHYIRRFNLGDAHHLIETANVYKIAMEEFYVQELSILNSASEEEQISKIKAIITKARTSTPYYTYAQKASNSLKECNKLIKKIHNGIPKLKAQYQKFQTNAHQYDPLKLAEKIEQTEKALQVLKNLAEELSILADHIRDLYIICTRTEEYRSEMQLIQLAKINDSLNRIRVQNAFNTSIPQYYYVPVYRYY